jgi:hypothetical protein
MEDYIEKFKTVLNGFYRGYTKGVTPTKGPFLLKALQNSKYFLHPVADFVEATSCKQQLVRIAEEIAIGNGDIGAQQFFQDLALDGFLNGSEASSETKNNEFDLTNPICDYKNPNFDPPKNKIKIWDKIAEQVFIDMCKAGFDFSICRSFPFFFLLQSSLLNFTWKNLQLQRSLKMDIILATSLKESWYSFNSLICQNLQYYEINIYSCRISSPRLAISSGLLLYTGLS